MSDRAALVWEILRALPARLGFNLLFFGALWGMGFLLGVLLPSFLPLVAAAILWVVAAGYAMTTWEDHVDGWGLLLSALPAILSALASGPWLALTLATPTPWGSLEADPSGPVVILPPGVEGRVELTWTHVTSHRSKGGGTTRSEWVVAPLVPAGWTPAEPVSAWFGCTKGFPFDCEQPPAHARLGVLADWWGTSGLEEATERACAAHGLRCDDDPVIVQGVDSLDQAIADEREGLWTSLLVGYLGWALSRVVWDLWRATRVCIRGA